MCRDSPRLQQPEPRSSGSALRSLRRTLSPGSAETQRRARGRLARDPAQAVALAKVAQQQQ